MPIVHATNLPGPNPSLPLMLVWSITDMKCTLELKDPMGTTFHTYEYTIGDPTI